MCARLNVLIVFSILLVFSPKLHASNQNRDMSEYAVTTFLSFLQMFQRCVHSHMPSQQFSVDNVKRFINYPSRTTVGSGIRFTSNRKFFANLVSTRAFKDMFDKDVEEMKFNLHRKMKFCDEIVMDQEVLKDFYDRDIDQSRI